MKISESISEKETKYNVKINPIHSGKSMIYPCHDPEDIRDLSVKELYKKINKTLMGSYRKYLFNI